MESAAYPDEHEQAHGPIRESQQGHDPNDAHRRKLNRAPTSPSGQIAKTRAVGLDRERPPAAMDGRREGPCVQRTYRNQPDLGCARQAQIDRRH
jgi:hypothetical protein